MPTTRRDFLKTTAAVPAAFYAGGAAAQNSAKKYNRIALEEAWTIPEVLSEWRKVIESGAADETGFHNLFGPILTNPKAAGIRARLTDFEDQRLAGMDATGITMQVLSIASPGVQVLPTATATGLATLFNDRLAAVIADRPDRYSGLAAIAPQDPEAAAQELERAVNTLKLPGALINSHTKGEFLDEPKYEPILAAAQSLDVPIYLHPRTPPNAMVQPFLTYALEGAGWGFAAESSLHALRLIFSGTFDKFPRLKIILGHMGEGLPFWLKRLDERYKLTSRLDTTGRVVQLQKQPSEYFLDNFVITTSGVNWHPALMLSHEVLGAERIMFAVDYPYESNETSVEFMDSAPVSEADRQLMYAGNAERLLRLTL